MSYIFTPRAATVEANTVYDDSEIACSNVTCTLPAVEHTTVDVPGVMGTLSLPLKTMLEDLELTIDFNGEMAKAAKLCQPKSHVIMIKWVTDEVKSEGTVEPYWYEARMSAYPVDSLPEISTELGGDIEQELTFKLWEYSFFEKGQQLFYLNRFSNILKVWDGKKLKDYSEDFHKYL